LIFGPRRRRPRREDMLPDPCRQRS
jgi:hypothetical protein